MMIITGEVGVTRGGNLSQLLFLGDSMSCFVAIGESGGGKIVRIPLVEQADRSETLEKMGEIVRRSLEAPIKVKIAGETEDKRLNFGFRSHLRWLSGT
jgi:hypothetical protein